MKKYIPILIGSVAFVLASFILGYSFKNRNKSNNSISVTGSGSKDFISDLIVWKGTFSKNSFELKEAYSLLEQDRIKIKNYLNSKGFTDNEIVFSAVVIQKLYNTYYGEGGSSSQTFAGYGLTQDVTLESKNVAKVENLSRQVTELINNGVELSSGRPSYYYTKLSDLKIKMIADATQDAKNRAQKIAENAGCSLGKLKKASMGVFQITAQNSPEDDYSWGGAFNTSSKNKTANITIRLEYEIN